VARLPIRTNAPRPYRAVIALLRPPIAALTRQDWSGGEHLPRDGGFIVAANHNSEVDAFMMAHYLVDHGCPPLFLAKSSLFEVPLLGRALHALGQVPVYRGTARAHDALRAAEEAVRRGACVAIMPEGTLTRDPDLWPMRARTGVGRLALATRAPVIPIAQWGPQALLAPYARRPTGLFSRHTMHVKAGPPVDLSDLYGRESQPAALREATDRVMAAITAQLAEIRGEESPEQPFDPRRAGREPAGEDGGPAGDGPDGERPV
jgi:1-acyl-sn-glycerol-3-phosphate acyltransferase